MNSTLATSSRAVDNHTSMRSQTQTNHGGSCSYKLSRSVPTQELRQTRHHSLNRRQRPLRILHPHRLDPHLLDRKIIPPRKNRIPHKHHLIQRNPTLLTQPPHPIRLIHAQCGNINRRRPAQINREPGQPRLQIRLNDPPLRKIRIPNLLFRNRSLLSQRRKRNLTPAVFDPFAPGVSGLETGDVERGVKSSQDGSLVSGVKRSA